MTKKILIIDDDEDMCEEMAEILEDDGYYVSMAFDGLKGRELIEKYDYDILLLDLKLPRLNGLAILKSIKEKNMKLKVLILTGRPLTEKLSKEETDADRDKEGDILKMSNGVINKPFDVRTVLSKVKELIGDP